MASLNSPWFIYLDLFTWEDFCTVWPCRGGRKDERSLRTCWRVWNSSCFGMQPAECAAERTASFHSATSAFLRFYAAAAATVAVWQRWLSGDLSQVLQQQSWTFYSPLRAAAPELSGTRSPSGCGPQQDTRRSRSNPCMLALHTRAT